MADKKKSRIVVEALAAEASARFIDWLIRNPKIAFRLDPADIKVEQVRGSNGQNVIRYRVWIAQPAGTKPSRAAGTRGHLPKPRR